MSAHTQVVVVPGVLALLPEYAGQSDPVGDLRTAALDAVGDLGDAVVLSASAQGVRVAEHLLAAAGHARVVELPSQGAAAYLVVANGSAMRTDKAPGHFDERAEAFDADVARRFTEGGLGELDTELAAELWADAEALVELDRIVAIDPASVRIAYDDDPHGVQYWVLSASGTRR